MPLNRYIHTIQTSRYIMLLIQLGSILESYSSGLKTTVSRGKLFKNAFAADLVAYFYISFMHIPFTFLFAHLHNRYVFQQRRRNYYLILVILICRFFIFRGGSRMTCKVYCNRYNSVNVPGCTKHDKYYSTYLNSKI